MCLNRDCETQDTVLYEEQAQYHGVHAVDTRRHLITPTTKNSTAGYSTAFNLDLYKKSEYK